MSSHALQTRKTCPVPVEEEEEGEEGEER